MDDQTKAAFESAADTSKQLITLATGILALEITFAKDVIQNLNGSTKCFIGVSWILLLLSIAMGVWTLLGITGSLGRKAPLSPQSISGETIRYPAIIQILLFLAGLLLMVWFGIKSV